VYFLGQFDHSLDAKQRLAIPAELREVLKPKVHGEAFVAAPGLNGSLWLWPELTFEALSSTLGGSIVGDEDLQEFERLVFSQAARVPLDTAGRVRIPDRLLSAYGLSGSVTILGVRDHLELLTPEAWRAAQERLKPVQADIWKRARQALAQRPAGGGVAAG
jgi:MraZ protein